MPLFVVSKFNDIRQAIQSAASSVANAVYQARRPSEEYIYNRVIVVGHSFGSLIIYDALNRLINEEIAEGNALTIPYRTKLFRTFGSPLDKTAFIFRTQKKGAVVREALAAAK